MQPKKLEHYKYFQPIAWTLCISFAGFVMMLALQMTGAIQNLEDSSLTFEHRLLNVEGDVGFDTTSE